MRSDVLRCVAKLRRLSAKRVSVSDTVRWPPRPHQRDPLALRKGGYRMRLARYTASTRSSAPTDVTVTDSPATATRMTHCSFSAR